MSNLEYQLREAMRAAVVDAEPRGEVMELVRRRYRRRNRRIAAVSALALATVVAAVPLAGAWRGGGPPAHRHSPDVRLFPGGGRILLRSDGKLRWLYPDGRIVTIASGFAGASLAGRELLAWKNVNPPGSSRFLPKRCFDPECTRFYGVDYYTMNLDGSNSRLVLPAESPVGNTGIYHADVLPSPDGSRLAYLRVVQRRNGTQVASEMWTVNLKTGQRTDLGSYSRSFVWNGDTTILADSANGRFIQLVNVVHSNRTTYLTVRDPRLLHAYERARPGHGPPVTVSLDGWSPGSNPPALALSLAGRGANSLSAELVIQQSHVLAFAPDRNQIYWLTWGHDGVFLLHTGEGDDPGSWNTYIGTVQSQGLVHAQNVGDPWDVAIFNPHGNVIVFFYNNGDAMSFVPVTSPACGRTGGCLQFQPKSLFGRGTPLAWAR